MLVSKNPKLNFIAITVVEILFQKYKQGIMSIHELLLFYKTTLSSKENMLWLCFRIYLAMHDPYTNENNDLFVKENAEWRVMSEQGRWSKWVGKRN